MENTSLPHLPPPRMTLWAPFYVFLYLSLPVLLICGLLELLWRSLG